MGCCGGSSNDQLVLFPEKRRCTDVCWSIIFTALAGCSIVGVSYCGTVTDVNKYLKYAPDIDFTAYWHLAGICAGFALLFTILLMCILQFMTRCMVYTFLGLASGAGFAVMGVLWYIYSQSHNVKHLCSAVFMTLVCLFWCFFLVFVFVKIDLVLSLYEIASRIIYEQPMLLFVSVVSFVIYISGIIVITYMALVVAAAKFEYIKNLDATKKEGVIINLLIAFVIFVGIWFQCFAFACTKFIIGYVVGIWYFTEDKSQVRRPVSQGLAILFRYHLGSMLFGSFVMAAIHVIRMVLEYMRNLRSENIVLNCIATFAACLIQCCKSFWDMLSSNAYYLVAFFGIPFSHALKLGMELTTLGVTAMFYMVGNIMVNVGIILVVAASTLFSRNVATHYELKSSDEWIVYAMLIGIGLVISSVLLTVYSTITRALYVCVCVDIRQNSGVPSNTIPALRKYMEQNQGTTITKGAV